jgi:uncharacterized protein
MIYLDTSVVLAALFNEHIRPPQSFWAADMFSSRLLQYEVSVRLNAVSRPPQAVALAKRFFETVNFISLARPVLERVLLPFPVQVRTLDAIHLATAISLVDQGLDLQLATYDKRLSVAAQACGVKLASF